MPVVGCEEERLANDALVSFRGACKGGAVPGAENVGQRAVDCLKVREEFDLLAKRRADREGQRARGADSFLYEVGECPAATDIGCIGRRRRRDG